MTEPQDLDTLDPPPRAADAPDAEAAGWALAEALTTAGQTAGDAADLLAVLGLYGNPCAGCAADFNMDGVVNVVDLLIVLATWGPCPQEAPLSSSWPAASAGRGR